jgi:hypothetical protein
LESSDISSKLNHARQQSSPLEMVKLEDTVKEWLKHGWEHVKSERLERTQKHMKIPREHCTPVDNGDQHERWSRNRTSSMPPAIQVSSRDEGNTVALMCASWRLHLDSHDFLFKEGHSLYYATFWQQNKTTYFMENVKFRHYHHLCKLERAICHFQYSD